MGRNSGFIDSGQLDELNEAITFPYTNEYSTGGLIVTGTWVGTMLISASIDGTNFANVIAQPIGGGVLSPFITANGSYLVNLTGVAALKVLMYAYTSGTVTVSLYGTAHTLFNRSLVAVAGATDSTLIGNVSDAFKVETDPVSSYSNITGNTTSTVKSGAGRLRGILIGDNTTGGSVVVYDNTAGSGTKITTIQIGSPSGGLLSSSGQPGPVYLPLNTTFSTGLTVVTSGSSSNNITVVYR